MIALAAVIPTQTRDLVSHATPARDYADAISRVIRQQESDDRVVAPGGRSVLMTHGGRTARTVILFHGFTNSPRPFEHLATRLYAARDNVYIPQLPHRAERDGTAASLADLTAEEPGATPTRQVDVADGLGDRRLLATSCL